MSITDELPEAALLDMDGTAVDVTSVRHHVIGKKRNFTAFHNEGLLCPPHYDVMDWSQEQVAAGRDVLVVTARKYMWEVGSIEWLDRHLPVKYFGPFMRGDTDDRRDVEVKRDIFDLLSTRWRITHAADDNPDIIELWRSLGLDVYVKPGWFDPADWQPIPNE